MPNFFNGVFAFGVFAGIVFCLAADPIFQLIQMTDLGIKPEHIFAAVASGLTAAWAGLWLYSLGKAEARATGRRQSAEILRTYLVQNRTQLTELGKHIMQRQADRLSGKLAVHPLLALERRFTTPSYVSLPREHVTNLLTSVTKVAGGNMVALDPFGQVLNSEVRLLAQHRERLLTTYTAPPHSISSGELRFLNADAERAANDQAEALEPDIKELCRLLTEMDQLMSQVNNELIAYVSPEFRRNEKP